jgi:hypothetical protein
MHNLLCHDGHDLVLSSSLGSLELAVDILCTDLNPSVKSAASKFLDQCCFDERSKLAAATLLPIPKMADILRQSLSKGCQASPARTREEANKHALLQLVEDMLSVLWNASDDFFFSSSSDWERVTALLCQPSLLDALRACLTSPVMSHQQAASCTLHNMVCNPALLPRLLEAGVAAELLRNPPPAPSDAERDTSTGGVVHASAASVVNVSFAHASVHGGGVVQEWGKYGHLPVASMGTGMGIRSMGQVLAQERRTEAAGHKLKSLDGSAAPAIAQAAGQEAAPPQQPQTRLRDNDGLPQKNMTSWKVFVELQTPCDELGLVLVFNCFVYVYGVCK